MTIARRFVPVHAPHASQARLLNGLLHELVRPEPAAFVPAVDVYEDQSRIVLTLETPGIAPENLNLRLENNRLTVEGERKLLEGLKPENFQRIERRLGSFTRSFALPQTVDTEQVTAHSEHGVLTIELPKKAAAQPKQIKVGVTATAEPQATPEAQANQPAAAVQA